MGKDSSVTVGYKYLLGMHAILCQSSIDGILAIEFGDRFAWGGLAINKTISVRRPNLFGGKSREGGVSGYIDVEGGESTQDQNAYLASRLDGLVPNFRGVVALVFKQFYWGNNPYIKSWRVKVRNCYATFGNFEKRYALINPEIGLEFFSVYIALDNSASMLTDDRGALAIEAVVSLVDALPLRNPSKIAVAFIRWSDVVDLNISYVSPNAVQIGVFKANVQLTAFDGNGTNFDAAFTNAEAFFNAADALILTDPTAAQAFNAAVTNAGGLSAVGEAAENQPLRRVIYFVTDGEPFPISSVDDALDTIGDITGDVEIYACLIAADADTADTQYVDQIDSAGEATVIDANNVDSLASLLQGNVSSFADINPIHVMRDVLLNTAIGGTGDESIIGDTFATAAATIFAEGLGMSTFWQNTNDRDSFKQSIENHINGRFFFDSSTGKWEVKLIRPDYVVANLFTFDSATIIEWTDYPVTPRTWELTNQVTVVYTNRDNGKDASVTLTNNAGVLTAGKVIPEKINMPFVTFPATANKLAQRELQARSIPITKGAIRVGYAPTDLNVGSAFIINEPRLRIFNMVCRVTELEESDGKDNSVLIRFATDVFAYNPVDEPWAETDVATPADFTALPPNFTLSLEIPFYVLTQRYGEVELLDYLTDDPDLGYFGAACDNPGTNHISAQVSVYNGTNYIFTANAPFMPTFQLTSDLTGQADDTTFTCDETGDEGQLAVGDLLLINKVELVRLVSVSVADGVSTFTVGRGCLDTVPVPHPVGSYIVDWVDYIASENTRYTAGEVAQIKVAPQTRSDIVDLSDLTDEYVYFDSRAFSPYPVGKLQADGNYFLPDGSTGTITMTWTHRDRLSQTTATVDDHTAASIGPEAGVEYSVVKRLLEERANVFAPTDFFDVTISDFFVDYDTYRTVLTQALSPAQALTYDVDVDDVDIFDYSDVFAQSDWWENAFVDDTVLMGLGVSTSRDSPAYTNYQTPFVYGVPLLPAVNLTAEYDANVGGAVSSPAPAPVDPITFVYPSGFYFDIGYAEKFQDSAFTTPIDADGQTVGSMRDQTSYGFDGTQPTAASEPQWDSYDGSLVFDGSADHMETLLEPQDEAMTYAVRFRADLASSGTEVLIGVVTNGGTDRAWLSLTDGVLSTGVGGNGSNATQDPESTDLRSATVWHTGAVSWDSNYIYLYLDGVLILTEPRVAGAANTTHDIYIGARSLSGVGADLYFDGEISHALAAHRVFTEAEHSQVHEDWSA